MSTNGQIPATITQRVASDCVISVDLDAVKNILITSSELITIMGQKARKFGGWSLKDIIECAAYRLDDGTGQSPASGHGHLFLERFEQTAENVFLVAFGS